MYATTIPESIWILCPGTLGNSVHIHNFKGKILGVERLVQAGEMRVYDLKGFPIDLATESNKNSNNLLTIWILQNVSLFVLYLYRESTGSTPGKCGDWRLWVQHCRQLPPDQAVHGLSLTDATFNLVARHLLCQYYANRLFPLYVITNTSVMVSWVCSIYTVNNCKHEFRLVKLITRVLLGIYVHTCAFKKVFNSTLSMYRMFFNNIFV